jgi:hypothetical protein
MKCAHCMQESPPSGRHVCYRAALDYALWLVPSAGATARRRNRERRAVDHLVSAAMRAQGG